MTKRCLDLEEAIKTDSPICTICGHNTTFSSCLAEEKLPTLGRGGRHGAGCWDGGYPKGDEPLSPRQEAIQRGRDRARQERLFEL